MTPERYRLIDALADRALELPAEERERFLDRECRGDPDLRIRVDQLLAAQESSAQFLEAPVLEVLAKDMAAPPVREDLTGRRVHHYVILSRLGAGGIGEVWLAKDELLTREIAVKLLFPRFAGDPYHVRRFEQEARSASTLNHPNIVTIYEIGKSEGVDFIAQELVHGQTLRKWLADGPVKLVSVLDVGAQVAAALEAAHGAGIVHRDIKPENVMIRPDGLVKVLDFGLARFIERDSVALAGLSGKESITQPGFVLGTVRYMSPEQARGMKVDTRSDLFSLGVVLYEMATGSAPFRGPTPSDVLAAILTHEPAPLSEYLPDTPPELERIIRRCLEKDLAARYPDVKELRQDLNNFRRRIELGGGAAIRADDRARSIKGDGKAIVGEKAPWPRLSHGALWMLSGGAAAILIALGILIFAGRSRMSPALNSISPFNSMQISRLTTGGEVADAAISTDGKYVGYVLDEERGQGLWIVQLVTGGETRIIAPEAGQHTGLSFSPDGNYLYYRRRVDNGIFSLYRVPVQGGEPVQLKTNVSGIAFSPDGGHFAFFRVEPSNQESSLMVANADGAEERRVATRRLPRYFSRYSLAWSPDGRWIACFAGDAIASTPQAFHRIEVRVADGMEKTITTRAWRWGGSIVWPTSGNALLFDATDRFEDGYQIWTASLKGGEVSRLTNDLNDYTRLSVTSDAKTMLALETLRSADIWVAPEGDSNRAAQITFGNIPAFESVAWTAGGKIVYSAEEGDRLHISIMDADGLNLKRLTRGPGNEVEVATTRDGKYIVYQSEGKIWRIDSGGGHALQLTHGAMDVHPDPSADSRFVIYASFTGWSPGIAGEPTLWRVPIQGGAPIELSPAPASIPKVSADGKLVAFKYFPGSDPQLSPHQIGLMSSEGGPPTRIFDKAPPMVSDIFWAPDGKALQFAVLNRRVGNIWEQPLSGASATQITRFTAEQLFTFAWSQDGRQLATVRGKIARDVVLIANFQ